MIPKRNRAAAGLAAALAALVPAAPAVASATLTYVSGNPGSYSVTDLSNSAIASGAVVFSLSYSSPTSAGAVTLSYPATLTATAGGTLTQSDFSVRCTQISGTSGAFTSLGTVRLSGTSVNCATLPRGFSNANLEFQVVLYLDGSATAPHPFPAGSYSGDFTLTATAS